MKQDSEYEMTCDMNLKTKQLENKSRNEVTNQIRKKHTLHKNRLPKMKNKSTYKKKMDKKSGKNELNNT